MSGGLSRRISAADLLTALGDGAAGQVLMANGGIIPPTWSDPPAPGASLVDLHNISGVVNIAATLGNSVYKGVLTGNITTFGLTTSHVGFSAVLIALTQGTGGGFTMAFPGNFRWQGGFSPSLQTVAGATDLLQALTFDSGASWLAAIVLQAAP